MGFVTQVECLSSITANQINLAPNRVVTARVVRFGFQVGFEELDCLIITAMRISIFPQLL